MVVDYKNFKRGEVPRNGLLWVLEQLPGHVHAEDLTDVLISQGYWGSYNAPFFPSIFNISGRPELAKTYGNYLTYDLTPRALIFKRDHVKVTDLNSMTKLMRYNNYKEDPLSRCNCTPPYSANLAISARDDLTQRNGSYPFYELGPRCHGGTDMKLTNYEMMKNLLFISVSGPTHDDVPPFQWSTSGYDKDHSHMGHPDRWNFDPILHKWIHP